MNVTNIGKVGPTDIFFHGWKDRIVGKWWANDVDITNCKTAAVNWTTSLLPEVMADTDLVALEIKKRGINFNSIPTV